MFVCSFLILSNKMCHFCFVLGRLGLEERRGRRAILVREVRDVPEEEEGAGVLDVRLAEGVVQGACNVFRKGMIL